MAPIPARETVMWRSRRNLGLRIDFGHSLERDLTPFGPPASGRPARDAAGPPSAR